MPVPLEPQLDGVVLHDENAVPISAANPLPVSAVLPPLANIAVDGNEQIQTVEAIGLLAGGAAFDGASKDNINHEAMSASLTVSSTLGTTVTVRFQQRATGADTFRDADVASFAVPAGGAPGPLVNFDRVWSVTRRFGRIRVENTGANPLTTAELVVMQKPIS